MKKFFIKILSFCFILFITLYTYGAFCEWFFKQNKYSSTANKRGWVMRHENRDYDYAVLGSSRGDGAFDMKMLDSIISMRGINIASNGAGYVDNYLVLRRFLENNNKIRYLFLQTDIYSLDPIRNFSNSFHAYQFLPFWQDIECRNAIYGYLDKSDSILFTMMPWVRFYKYNRYFSPLEIITRFKSSQRDLNRMDHSMKAHDSIEKWELTDSSKFYKKINSRKIYPENKDLEYLLKTIDYAKYRNIKVICFTAPDFYFQDSVFANYTEVSKYLFEHINAKGVQILPQPLDIRLNINNFKDPGHLSDVGRFRYTTFFSKEIINYLD